jgi:ABC-type antimicrobial peptide transport system permease subunit
MVARQALLLALGGAALGLLAAAGLSRYLTSLLFGVSPLDPVTFIAAPLVLGLGAIVAAVVPAVRAARIAPAVALRQE